MKVDFFYCEFCGWKKISREKLENFTKCKKCGRLLKVKKMEDFQLKNKIKILHDEKNEEFNNWVKNNFEE